MPLLLAAPDKFRGTASASAVAGAMARAARSCGWDVDEQPMADGGEGLLDVIGGRARFTRVRGPLDRPVEAEWRVLDGAVRTAVIEMARASGLVLAGGPDGNDPMNATTAGTGELVMAAVASGARRIVVGCGGSATTDGGLGAVRAIGSRARLGRTELVVACDVKTRFEEAAEVFAAQKGATRAQIGLLGGRLRRLAQVYRSEFGIDVGQLEGGGAAGGLAGGLAALGARLASGFDLVADMVGIAERIQQADLVATGEGYLDKQSFEGKVVGGVAALAARSGKPVVAVVGDADPLDPQDGGHPSIEVLRLVREVGRERSLSDTVRSIEEVVARHLSGSGT